MVTVPSGQMALLAQGKQWSRKEGLSTEKGRFANVYNLLKSFKTLHTTHIHDIQSPLPPSSKTLSFNFL